MWTANDIKNLSLMEIAHEIIIEWNDKENTDVQIINTQYELAKKVALSRHGWSFAEKNVHIELSEETEQAPSPNAKYKYIADLPNDVLCNVACYTDPNARHVTDFYVVGNILCANTDKLYLKYTANVHECNFTAEFVDWFKVFFAQRLNPYLNGDLQRQQVLMNEEVVLFRTAKNIDTKRNKHESLDGNPLLWCR